eukprot:2416531-Prymnesium_polylepis.1
MEELADFLKDAEKNVVDSKRKRPAMRYTAPPVTSIAALVCSATPMDSDTETALEYVRNIMAKDDDLRVKMNKCIMERVTTLRNVLYELEKRGIIVTGVHTEERDGKTKCNVVVMSNVIEKGPEATRGSALLAYIFRGVWFYAPLNKGLTEAVVRPPT